MKTWKTDLEATKQRYVEWWSGKGIILNMWEHFQQGVTPHADIAKPKEPSSLSQKWFDPQWRADYLDWYVAHSCLKADILPVANTQLGPGSLAAILGGVFEGGEDTIWIHPDPNYSDDIKFNPEHPNYKLHKDLLRACKAKAQGHYYVGMPDLMEGMDVLAALKGTDRVLIDTVMQPEVLERQMQTINDIYFKVFDELYDIIREGDEMAFCYFSAWAPGKMSKLQSDISTMISEDDYRRFVQPFIREQCRKIPFTLYHLDGVGAMHHLPALLEIEELNAIQWTPGVGEPQGGSPKWWDLYKKILDGGKSVMACWVTNAELKPLLQAIGTDGVHVEMDFHNEQEVEEAMRIVDECLHTPLKPAADDSKTAVRNTQTAGTGDANGDEYIDDLRDNTGEQPSMAIFFNRNASSEQQTSSGSFNSREQSERHAQPSRRDASIAKPAGRQARNGTSGNGDQPGQTRQSLISASSPTAEGGASKSRRPSFRAVLNGEEGYPRRVLVLDGATGTMIQQYRLREEDYRGARFATHNWSLRGCNDVLSLTCPFVLRDIHRKYLDAGADIIETDTFNAQRISMADYGLEAYCREINMEAARIAREVADEYTLKDERKPRFVAGSMGPTAKTTSISTGIGAPLQQDVLRSAYREQADALIDGGVDIILIETIFDTLNARLALEAASMAMAERQIDMPVMLSFSLATSDGHNMLGQSIPEFIATLPSNHIVSVGVNCVGDVSMAVWLLHELASRFPYRISLYPNAGMPDSQGRYQRTPEMLQRDLWPLLESHSLNIVGGCCGTTDRHIRKIAQMVQPVEGLFLSPLSDERAAREETNVADSKKKALT